MTSLIKKNTDEKKGLQIEIGLGDLKNVKEGEWRSTGLENVCV